MSSISLLKSSGDGPACELDSFEVGTSWLRWVWAISFSFALKIASISSSNDTGKFSLILFSRFG